jgi:hypothetical protein
MKPCGAPRAASAPRPFLTATLWGILALSCASCAAPLMTLPTGPGAPAADAADALAEATAACRGVTTVTAEIAVSGSASGRRVRGRLLAGASAPASLRLEAPAPFGPPVFIFAAVGDDATLLLPRDERVLEHGRPEAVLGAVAGVPYDAQDLFTTLTGCAPAGSLSLGRAIGPEWRVVRIVGRRGYDLYLHRDGGTPPWRLVAMTLDGAGDGPGRTEYSDFRNESPHTIRLRSGPAESPNGAGFDMTLVLSQVETNAPLGTEVFRIDIPPAAVPITVDELLRARLGLRED